MKGFGDKHFDRDKSPPVRGTAVAFKYAIDDQLACMKAQLSFIDNDSRTGQTTRLHSMEYRQQRTIRHHEAPFSG